MSRCTLWHASPPDATKVPLTFALESSTVTVGFPVAAEDKEPCGVGLATLLPELKRTGSSATIVRRGCARYRTAVPAALLHVTHEPPCGGIGTDVCQPRLSTGLRLVLSVEPRGRPGQAQHHHSVCDRVAGPVDVQAGPLVDAHVRSFAHASAGAATGV
jgi:hypothetical protein